MSAESPVRMVPFAVLGLLLYPAFTLVNGSGPPAGHTGAPSESVCTACHFSNPLNSGGGSVAIEAPERYTPGIPVEFTVRVQRSGMSAGGFQLTVKDASNQHAGTLQVIAGEGTRFTPANARYVTHSQPKQAGEWRIQWTPPAISVGPVKVYAAGNAANLNGSESGDFIYTSNTTIADAGAVNTGEESPPEDLALESIYPNPFRDRATVRYTVRQGGQPVTLTVYDAAGKRVSTQPLGGPGAGTHQTTLRAGNWPDGIYFVELRTPHGRRTRAIFLAR